MKIFIIKEIVSFEGDNICIVAAKNEKEAKQISEGVDVNNSTIYEISSISQYAEPQIIWSNC